METSTAIATPCRPMTTGVALSPSILILAIIRLSVTLASVTLRMPRGIAKEHLSTYQRYDSRSEHQCKVHSHIRVNLTSTILRRTRRQFDALRGRRVGRT